MTPIRETIARAIYLCDAPAASNSDVADAVLRALDEAGLVVVRKEPTIEMLAAATPIATGSPSPGAMTQAAAVIEHMRGPMSRDALVGIAQIADDYRAMIAASVVE